MTRYERVQAGFRGDAVDRIPISFWQHFPTSDATPEGLADVTIRYQQRFDLDFVKLMPTGMYSVMDYGVSVKPSQDNIGTTRYAGGPVTAPDDWARLPAVSPRQGVLRDQVTVVRTVRAALGPQVPIFQTIFSPLTMVAKLTGRSMETVVREHEAGLPAALERLGVPHDLQVLSALRPRAWGIILHLHGDDPFFGLADRYPIDAVNWHARETRPSLAGGLTATGRGLVGGMARMGPVVSGTPEEVAAEARGAVAQTGGRRLTVAPGCVIPTTATEANLLALRRAVEP